MLGGKCEWDLAAGDLILSEAGGRLSDLAGREIIYNCPDPKKPRGLIAGTTGVHREMLDMMASFKQ